MSFENIVNVVKDEEIVSAKRGRSASAISQDWYDLVEQVIANKGHFISLPVSDERVKSTVNVRTIIKRIAEEKGYKMAERDRSQKGNVMQVVSRFQKMNARTGKDEYFSTPKDTDETHVFIRYYSK